MPTWSIVLLIILVILLAILIGLYFFGRKAQRRQVEQQEQMEAIAQTVSLLVIDKKRLKIKESGLPQQVIDQTPKYLRWTKLPVVKAKIGPRIMTLACDAKVYELLPVKREAKVVISGIYITAVKSARGGLETPPPKKKGLKRFFGKKNK